MTEMVWAYFGEIGNMHGNWRLPFASNITTESPGSRDDILSSFLKTSISGDKLLKLKRVLGVLLNTHTHTHTHTHAHLPLWMMMWTIPAPNVVAM